MQRRATKNTRGPNAEEKRYQAWLKQQPCVWCHADGPSIVDHCRGATFKHNKTLIGHWFCISQCVECDTKKTIGGQRNGNEALAWFEQWALGYQVDCPKEVINSILSWNK